MAAQSANEGILHATQSEFLHVRKGEREREREKERERASVRNILHIIFGITFWIFVDSCFDSVTLCFIPYNKRSCIPRAIEEE
jgi:hypothetical protein